MDPVLLNVIEQALIEEGLANRRNPSPKSNNTIELSKLWSYKTYNLHKFRNYRFRNELTHLSLCQAPWYYGLNTTCTECAWHMHSFTLTQFLITILIKLALYFSKAFWLAYLCCYNVQKYCNQKWKDKTNTAARCWWG